MSEGLTQLARLPSELKPIAEAAGKPVPSYRALYTAVLNAELPAERIRGRLYVDPALAAVHFGLAAPVKGGRRQSASA